MQDIRIAKALEKIEYSLSKIEKNTRPAPSRFFVTQGDPERISTQSGTIIGRVEGELDWLNPAIKVEFEFVKRADGRVTVHAVIEGEDAALAEDILESVDYLQLSSVPR